VRFCALLRVFGEDFRADPLVQRTLLARIDTQQITILKA
jgi:hypothetical protein